MMLPILHQSRAPLRDPIGRGIGYFRLSLTRGCSMRCTYCRPAFDRQPRKETVLAVDEIEKLVRHLVERHGLSKVRLTGGDPTSRRELTSIIRRVSRIDGIRDLAMTTNALTLARRATEYADAGLRRVNVSLDSLDRERFSRMTGVDGLDHVLVGLDSAERAELRPIRLNTVVLRDENEHELPELLRFAAGRGWEIRFIELMPMGPLAGQWSQRYVPEARMRERLASAVEQWEPMTQEADSARRFRVTLRGGGAGVVGFITPMSCNFCADCNRLRVAADGAIFPCLMDEPRGNLLPALRPRFDPEQIDVLLARAYGQKRPEHPHDGPATMTHIGG